MPSLRQLPVFFWASNLSIGIHILTLMIPVKSQVPTPQPLPLESISLIPLPQEPKPSTRPVQEASQIPTQPSPIATPFTPPPVNPSPKELLENKNVEAASDQKKSVVNPTKQDPTKQGLTKQDPVANNPELETSEQFVTRIQTTLTQVTAQLEQQYGDRFAERSDTIAASPELFFTQPELFYDTKGTPLPGFDGKPSQIEKETPEQVFKNFESNLQKVGFTISPLENYGGGLLYEVKSKIGGNPEKIAFYLNLLSTPDKSGTIVVIWKQRP